MISTKHFIVDSFSVLGIAQSIETIWSTSQKTDLIGKQTLY